MLLINPEARKVKIYKNLLVFKTLTCHLSSIEHTFCLIKYGRLIT